MEVYEVVGFRRVEFTDEKTKNKVDGYTLFLQREPQDEKITGIECCKQFISCQYVSYGVLDFLTNYGKCGAIYA